MFAYSNRRRGGSGLLRLAGGALGLGLAALVVMPSGEATAKTPGSKYCFLGVCHRVKTIAETQALIGKTETMQASFYDDAKRDRFNPRNLTSSGEMFNAMRPDNAASPVLPDGTKVMVWSPTTKRAAVIRINNAGPYWGRRLIDLSRGAAEKLGFSNSGVATVQVRVLQAPSVGESTYRRGRVYAPVPGYLGGFASIDEAYTGARVALGGTGQPPVLVAVATWDAPVVQVAAGAVLPPPELGLYSYEASAIPVAEFEVVPATLLVAAASTEPEPSAILAAAALAGVRAGPIEAPVRVAFAPAAERRVTRKPAAPVAVKSSKPAPTRLAMAIQPVPRPSGVRAAGGVNQPIKVPAVKRQPAVVENEEEPDLRWVPRVLDGAQ